MRRIARLLPGACGTAQSRAERNVHIISAMEACDSYKPWHDKQMHRTFLRPDTGKCLHYYFYFIDKRYHPDRNPSSAELMANINAARATILNSYRKSAI
jgi:hypothetical protein